MFLVRLIFIGVAVSVLVVSAGHALSFFFG